MKLRLHNLTAFGQNTWAYLDEMADEDKPDAIAFVETHLMGVRPNRASEQLIWVGISLLRPRWLHLMGMLQRNLLQELC